MKSRIFISLTLWMCGLAGLHASDAQQAQEEPISTPDQCVKELLHVRDVLKLEHADLLTSRQGTASPSDPGRFEQTADEARSYRDELLSALSAMHQTVPKLSGDQLEELKSQPIQPVSAESVEAMRLSLEGDQQSGDSEEIVLAPALNSQALQAWGVRPDGGMK